MQDICAFHIQASKPAQEQNMLKLIQYNSGRKWV